VLLVKHQQFNVLGQIMRTSTVSRPNKHLTNGAAVVERTHARVLTGGP
jgi:hypothetical protein